MSVIKRYFNKADIFLLSGMYVTIIILAVIMGRYIHSGKSMVEVSVGDAKLGAYSLEENQMIPIVYDNETISTLIIEDGYAYVKDSVCPDKLCEKQGRINKDNQMIVCLPNKIIVKVIKGEDNEIDVMT